ncbi:hypothetical protein WMY93_003161 [Mugilogobius chulae]|uniref:Uncharacterized protein n=1 Tax=Mugilogobius chulae TaxID=88201 RepID=A0AAW0PWN8_9GOBI
MKSKERISSAVYRLLDFIETERPKCIQRFWRCAFKETIVNKYPTLRLLRNSLFDGSYACESALLEAVDNQDSDHTETSQTSQQELKMKKAGPKNTKKRKKTIDDDDDDEDDEQPSTSTQATPRLRKKSKKVFFCEKCIVVKRRWYTPSQFEQLAGKAANKNWKLSIHCMGTPLGQLLQEGHLKCVGYKRTPKAKKLLFPSEESTTVSVEIEDSDSESSHKNVLQIQQKYMNKTMKVMHMWRSIRTDTSWLTPVEFVKEVSCQTDYTWKKDIKCEGKPLGELIEAKVLRIHSLLCNCSLCVPDSEDLDNERNDDECWICLRESTEGETLVACDECPRSFHQKCHLPHISDAMLGDGRTWMCTLCVLSKTLTLYPELEMEAAMSSSISTYMLHCQYLLLRLYREDEDCIFKSDPCHLPKYESIISTPMWFDEVLDKLQTDKYDTVVTLCQMFSSSSLTVPRITGITLNSFQLVQK